MTTKASRSLIVFSATLGLAALLALWYGKRRQPAEAPTRAAAGTNLASPAATGGDAPVSAPIRRKAPAEQTPHPTPVPPAESKEQQMRERLAALNDVDIEFYGRLEDQFGNAVSNAEIKFDVPFNSGHGVGVQRGTTATDGSGFFTISGCKGKSLSVVPVKAGYALASLNGGGIYSHLWPESERVHPDRKNPTVIKMWRLQGAEPLVRIDQRYRLRVTGAPINFDLLAGTIVSSGGDVQITVRRPQGVISERRQEDWGVFVAAVDGGIIETTVAESRVTYSAPETGYKPTYQCFLSTTNHTWSGGIHQMLFVQSRGGRVYSKLFLSFNINGNPDDPASVAFSGIANPSGSRNWEGDPNTMRAVAK